MTDRPIAIIAAEVPAKTRRSNYPPPFATLVAARVKQPLGDVFGLKNFGVNRSVLPPGSVSALLHSHSRQDELVYILRGTAILRMGDAELVLTPGMCAGFAAGGAAHQLRNDGPEDVVYLEIGDRSAGDDVTYPEDDLQMAMAPDGTRKAAHKDGTPY